MFTSHDIVTSIQLSTNCDLTVCIFESKHDIKNLTASSYSAPLIMKTSKTKLEVIPCFRKCILLSPLLVYRPVSDVVMHSNKMTGP